MTFDTFIVTIVNRTLMDGLNVLHVLVHLYILNRLNCFSNIEGLDKCSLVFIGGVYIIGMVLGIFRFESSWWKSLGDDWN